MLKLNLKIISKWVDGKLYNSSYPEDVYVKDISIDTRDNLSEKLFVPIIGKNFDGHNFLLEALNKGAICVLTEKELKTDSPYILVNSTFKALKDLATNYRNLFDIPVIGITGSSGKTTTKDMVASVLSEKYSVLKTEGNFNNEIGLPLTIFKLDHHVDILVLEMGMNNFNEIHNLSKIARPNICIITNIGEAHIENLGSREGILKAKSEIFDYMQEDSKVILNSDDDMLITLKGKNKNEYFYSLKNNENNYCYAHDIKYLGLEGTYCSINICEKDYKIKIPISGEYMVYNALVAFIVGNIFKVSPHKIAKGIENFEPSKNRMDIFKISEYIIINDVYNANPSSVKASINSLSDFGGRKVCILGDMFELGNLSSEMHYNIGKYAINHGVGLLICIGKLSYEMYKGALDECERLTKSKKNVLYSDSIDNINLDNLFLQNDTILVKASRGMKFEKIIERLREVLK